MTRPEHWEPPDPPKLLVSSRRVAEELGVPLWKANEITWSLGRRFYAPEQVHFRVTKRSLDAFKRLLDQGLTLLDARAVMAHYNAQDELPPPNADSAWLKELAWNLHTRQRRF